MSDAPHGAAAAEPLVSVIITFYNQAEYVTAAVGSVLEQTYPNVEVIVVDDGSTDDTVAECMAFKDQIELVRQPNRGAAAARNHGLERARGSLIAHLDGDDLWEPDKLRIQVEAARQFPDAGLIAVSGLEFSPEGITARSLFSDSAPREFRESNAPFVRVACYDTLLSSNFLATPSQVMMPAGVFRAVGQWDSRFRVSADYELYLRVATRYPFVLCRQRLVRWRFSPGGLSGTRMRRGFTWALERQRVLRSHADVAPDGYRARIEGQRRADVVEGARAAYHSAQKHGGRAWATGYILRTVWAARRFSPSVLAYTLGTWCPAWIVDVLARWRGHAAPGRRVSQ